jgi:hypothetical protein
VVSIAVSIPSTSFQSSSRLPLSFRSSPFARFELGIGSSVCRACRKFRATHGDRQSA